MATRQVEIKITGESGNYEATVQRIIEKNNQLNRAAVQGAEQTTNAFGGLQRILINLPSLFGGIASGIAGAFSVGAIVGFTKQILNAAGEIDDLAKKTGFSRQTLSGLKSTIEENGGSLQAFATAINKAQKSLGDIEGDGKKAGEALKAMGLNVNELTKSSPEQFFEKFAQSLSQVEGQNQRVAIATKVMGRAGADQIPIILELTDKFKQLREQGVSDDNIKQLDKFGDALTRLKNATIGLAQGGLADLIRGFDRLFKISDIEKQRGALADYAKQIESIDKTLRTRESLRSKGLGFLTGSDDAEQLKNRSKALQDFIDANDKLIRLEQGDKDKPAIGGGSLPAVDEGAAKRQLDAIEAAKTALAQLTLSNQEAARAAGDHTIEVKALALALIDQEYTAAIKTAQANKSYTAQLGELLLATKEQKIAQLEAAEAALNLKRVLEDANRELETQADDAKTTAEAWGFYKTSLDNANQAALKAIETTKQVSDLEADRLTIIGKTSEAERLRLITQLNYIQALKDQEGIESLNIPLRNQQLKNVQTQIQQLGTVTINVGQTIANSVGDAFEGVILGTRKLADVGKGLMAALLRDIGSFFAQTLIKKLGFENILLTNAQSFGPQIAGAVSSGGTSGGGGIVGNLLGVVGKLGGGLSSMLAGLSSLLSGGGGSFGFGSAASGVAGPLFANGGFFSGISGSAGSGLAGTIISGISNAWSAISNAPLIAAMTSSIAEVGATIATTLTAVLDTITAALANPVTWIAAIVVAAITAIYRIIANQQERPNAKFSGQFQGVSFDEASSQFIPGDINVVIGRKSGIKNSDAGKIADNLQQRLTILAQQWTDILNIFPDFIAEDIQPALDETNRRLNQNFKDLKFSPGGSRNIQQELESLSGYAGLWRFFQAFAPSIEQGFRSSLQGGGIQIGSAAGFANLDPNRGFKWGAPPEDWDKFIAAIKDVAGLTSQLGSVGAGKFLTGSDLTNVGGLFDQLFSVTDSTTFVKAAAELKDKLKPALDFLQQSVQESTDLFGRGLMAALNAATESNANKAFLESLGAGVKDSIFNGIVQSFIASAQFGDLLAPIQQQIREFTQQALATGTAPDIAAFRRAILPAIEAIATRADILAPLIAELQKLGLDVSDLVTSLFGPEKLKPVDEFLQQSVKTATDLFGRGLIAALDAATSSQANEVFLASLGQGVKDILFKGITDAFIASAQFDNLLAPIQETIQAFTKEAIASGRTPDLAAFRAAILPQIGDLSSRAATLAPLIAELQKLGFDFKDALKVFAAEAKGDVKVEINIENFTNEDDPATLARKIQDLLGGRLAPAA